MLGDGCLSLVYGRKKYVSITGSSKDDFPFFNEVISPILKEFRGKDTNIKFRKSAKAIDFNFVDHSLFDLLVRHQFPIGKKGNSLLIPQALCREDLIRLVIQGFFATDGSLVITKNVNQSYPRLELHTISESVLRQVYDYLLTLGMHGGFYIQKSKPFFKNTQQMYRFQFNGVDNLLVFQEKIGFVNSKYYQKFLHFLDYHKKCFELMKHVRSNSSEMKKLRIPLNEAFVKNMALGRIELPTSAL